MGAMVSSVLNIQDLAKGISNKTYKMIQPLRWITEILKNMDYFYAE